MSPRLIVALAGAWLLASCHVVSGLSDLVGEGSAGAGGGVGTGGEGAGGAATGGQGGESGIGGGGQGGFGGSGGAGSGGSPCEHFDLEPCARDGVACFRFDGDLGDAKNGPSGMVGSGTISYEQSQAAVFDGSSYVEVMATNVLELPVSISIEVRVRIDSFGIGRRGLLDQQTSYGLFVHDDGSVEMTRGEPIRSPPNVVQLGTWHHIVATEANNQVRIYVDGVQVHQGSVPTSMPGSDRLVIGANANGNQTDQLFHGAFDHLQLYDRGLPLGEVACRQAHTFPGS
ncbi:MAG: LamG domain-containing protein [Polyangiaceae bacterium]